MQTTKTNITTISVTDALIRDALNSSEKGASMQET